MCIQYFRDYNIFVCTINRSTGKVLFDSMYSTEICQNESGIVNLDNAEEPGSKKGDPRNIFWQFRQTLIIKGIFRKQCDANRIITHLINVERNFLRYNESNCGQLCLQFLQYKRLTINLKTDIAV